MTVETWGITACHRPDIELTRRTLQLQRLPADRVILVANGPEPPTQAEIPEATVIATREQEISLTRWWNEALEYVSARAPAVHNIYVFDADSMASPAVVRQLAVVLRRESVAATCPDRHGTLTDGDVHIERRLVAQPQALRMTGYCFMLRGELGLRADTQFRFWYCDDDMEFQARVAGGVGMVGGCSVGHPVTGRPPSPYIQRCAEEDREKFIQKWGTHPWLSGALMRRNGCMA